MVDIFELIPSPILEVDVEGRVVQANEAARQAFAALASADARLTDILPDSRFFDLKGCIAGGPPILVCGATGDAHHHFQIRGIPGCDIALVFATNTSDMRRTGSELARVLLIALSLGQANFFKTVVGALAVFPGVRYAVLAEIESAAQRKARVLECWQQSSVPQLSEIDMRGTPFDALVLPEATTVILNDEELVAEYPDFELPKLTESRGFAGVPVRSPHGDAIGFLALLSVHPVQDYRAFHLMLEVFAACCAAEMQRRNAETRFEDILVSYEQQLKELSCIYSMAESLRTGESVPDICKEIVRIIPTAWRFPEHAFARIMFDGINYDSAQIVSTPFVQSSAIVVNRKPRGMVQVFYADTVQSRKDVGPFVASERKLLDTIARMLGEAIERHEAEADNRRNALLLAQELNRLETIVRTIGEGVVVTDTHDRVLLMNTVAQDLLGYSRREPVGENLLLVLHDTRFREMWRETASSGIDFTKEELRIESVPPRILWATRSRIPELLQGEDCFVTIFQDVTKQREIDQMKTDFVSAVSHELRTPMTSIKGFVSTLLHKPDIEPERRERFLSIIAEESERLMKLIEDLLEMASIESGRASVRLAPVEVSRVVETVASALLPVIEGKHLTFVRDIPRDLSPIVADASKLHTIIFNLVENATKFTPPGGTISISARADDVNLELTVKDSGIGIARENLDRLFERFYQVQHGSDKSPGTGLGLYLVKEMVTLHKGSVSVDSELGGGAVFRVVLPLTQES
ncbi:MAG: cell wall metabolism sensor histidine kinase WalK [Candidatus Hydrogenedentes bacterium]|nr:cell wall metabolism sensor histidine kinase WalK [Candidatus Hydrogenedentota bacterium]